MKCDLDNGLSWSGAEWCLNDGIPQAHLKECNMGYRGPKCNSDIIAEVDLVGKLIRKDSNRDGN